MLERLDPTAYKKKDYMITSDFFILQMSNGSQNAVNLLATRSFTRPVLLDLGEHQESSLEVEIQNSRYRTRIFSTQLLYPTDHMISTHSEFQGRVLVHTRRRRQVYWHLGWGQG